MFGIEFDSIDMNSAVDTVLDWSKESFKKCRYVVTPNVDHAVLFQERKDLREAYSDASLIVADGWPVVLASKILRQPVPERVPGSDLVPQAFQAANERDQELRVFLLGAGPGVAERAAANIEKKWSCVNVVDTLCPPIGFHLDPAENKLIIDRIREASPDILIVGLGAPKQELWVHQFKYEIRAKVALCVGATIDFLAGEKARAPKWVQSLGMEWAHRMCSEPKRLVKRYARDAWVFPQLVARQMFFSSFAKRSGF